VTTPAVGLLLLVFIGKSWLEGSTMQIEGDDIGGRERLLRQVREEEFVDDALSGEADTTLLFSSRMGRHHHPAALPRRPHRHIRAVVEGAHQLTFRACELLIGRQMQAALHLWKVQHAVVFAACHRAEACQIGQDGSRAILPIQPQHDSLLGQVMSLAVEPYRGHRPAQFVPGYSPSRRWIIHPSYPTA
jgi:hypothetical protein